MEYRPFGKTGIQISAIGIGCWEIGGGYGSIEETDFIKAVNRALDLGINSFDTAEAYGMGASEKSLAKALGGRRKEAVITTKFGVGYPNTPNYREANRKRIMASIDKSLGFLNTDHVDVYMVHWPDVNTPLEETMTALDEVVKAGRRARSGFPTSPWPRLKKRRARGASTSCSTAGICSTGACARRSFRIAAKMELA